VIISAEDYTENVSCSTQNVESDAYRSQHQVCTCESSEAVAPLLGTYAVEST